MTKIISLRLIAIAALVIGFVFAAHANGQAPTMRDETAPGELGIVSDQQQFNSPSVPVVVVTTVAGTGESEVKGKKQLLIKEVVLENRSTKDVSSVTVRWLITPHNRRTTSLSRGDFTSVVEPGQTKTLRAGQRLTLKLSHPDIGTLIRQIPNREAVKNKFAFVIGVAGVVFEDGSTWKEQITPPAAAE